MALYTIHDVPYHTVWSARQAIERGVQYCEALTDRRVMGKRIRCTKVVNSGARLCTQHRKMEQ